MLNFDEYLTSEARLIILKELYNQRNRSLTDNMVHRVLDSFSHNRSRAWVRTQLRMLEELGAVTITEAGTALISTLTDAGIDHLQRRVFIEDIDHPSKAM